jgi:uncharacterized protein
MIVVSDTSALSNLALIDHLWLLEAIYQAVIIPEVVADQLASAYNSSISTILQLGWMQTQPITDSQLANQLQQERGLDAGEANAIALALELQADDLLIDERIGGYWLEFNVICGGSTWSLACYRNDVIEWLRC